MKVLLFGGQDIWREELIYGFEALGHEAIVKMPRSIEEFDHLLSQFAPDLIITFGCTKYYTDQVLAHLGELSEQRKVKYIHWDTEGITLGITYELPFIQVGKPWMVFTVCPEMLVLLRQHNIRSELMFYGFTPKVHHPTAVKEAYQGKITLLGHSYSNVLCKQKDHMRTKSMYALVKPLLDHQIQVDFWGDQWHVIRSCMKCELDPQNVHGYCDYHETAAIYSNCFVNLVPQNSLYHLTKRTYEILGCGGFILTYDTPEVRKYFTHKKDILLTSCGEETLDLVNYYRQHPEEREEIKYNALQSAKNHTYEERVKQLLEVIKKEEK